MIESPSRELTPSNTKNASPLSSQTSIPFVIIFEAFLERIPGITIMLISISSGLDTVSNAFLNALYPLPAVELKLNPKLFPGAKSLPRLTGIAGLTPSNPPWNARVNLLACNAEPVVTVEPELTQFSNLNAALYPMFAVSLNGAR